MGRSILPVALMLIALAAFAAPAHQPSSPASRTLTDDFISIGTDGKVHPKDEILGDFASTELAEYRPYNIQVVQLNDNAAIVTYDVIVRMVHYDDETPRYQHVSSIWVKQGDQWRLKFQQATAAS